MTDYAATLLAVQDFMNADNVIAKCLNIFADNQPDPGTREYQKYGHAWLVLGKLRLEEGDFEGARSAIAQGRKYLSGTSDGGYLIELYNCNMQLVNLDEFKGDHAATYKDLERAGTIARQLHSSNLLAAVNSNLKRLKAFPPLRDDGQEAIRDALRRELALPVSQARSWDIASVIASRCSALDNTGHRVEAVKEYKKTLDAFQIKNKDTLGAAYLHLKHAQLLIAAGENEKGKAELIEAADIQRRHSEDAVKLGLPWLGSILIELGRAEQGLKNFSGARTDFESGLKSLSAKNDTQTMQLRCTTYLALSDIHKRDGNWAAAKNDLQNAAKLAHKINNDWLARATKIKLTFLNVAQSEHH